MGETGSASELKVWSLNGASINDFRVNFRGSGLDVLFHLNARFSQRKASDQLIACAHVFFFLPLVLSQTQRATYDEWPTNM